MLALRPVLLVLLSLYLQLSFCEFEDGDVDEIRSSTYTISCAARKDISPCSCYQHGTKAVTIRVICQQMTSFAQIIQTLRKKLDKANQIQLIIELSNLEDLSEKKFSDLESYIAEIWLRKNNMGGSLSTKSFEGIATVTSLMLIDSKINEFPGTIFEHMPNVDSVTIQRTLIKSVSPADFKSLKKLSTLAIVRCNLTYIESNTFSPTLKRINLNTNNISTLNHTLRNNTLLEMIVLANNNIGSLEEQFPDYVANNKLIYLDVSFNKLASFPKTFANMNALTTLLANVNQIKSLDNVLSNKPKLSELDLTKNQISQLSTTEFEGCSALNRLDMSFNELWALNYSMLPLQSLEVLNLTRNKLTEFSIAEIAGLKNLKLVDLTHNKLRKFIGQMENETELPQIVLNELELQFNELQVLQGSLSDIKNLKSVNLSHNSLTAIPSEFLTGLVDLHQLDVSHNQLFTLQDVAKASLPALGILWATYNKITELSQQADYGFTAVCFMHLQNNNINLMKPDFMEKNQCVYKPGVNATLYVYLEGNNVLCKDDIQEIINSVESRNNTKIMGHCSKVPSEGLKYNVGQTNNTDASSITVVTLEH